MEFSTSWRQCSLVGGDANDAVLEQHANGALQQADRVEQFVGDQRFQLERGELVVCGREHWRVPLEVRLYRCALVRKAPVRLLWRKLEAGAERAWSAC